MAILTFEEYQEIDKTANASNQAKFEQYIASAEEFIYNYTGNSFSEDEKSYFDEYRRAIVIPEYPVSNVRVFVDPESQFGPETETSSLIVNGNLGKIIFNCEYSRNTPVKITYTPNSTVPPDIKYACSALVGYFKVREAQVGVKSVQNNTTNTTYSDFIPDHILKILDQHRVK